MVLSGFSTVLEQIACPARLLWLLSSAGFYVTSMLQTSHYRTCKAAGAPL